MHCEEDGGSGGITVQHFHHFHRFIARPEASSSGTRERERRARKLAQQERMRKEEALYLGGVGGATGRAGGRCKGFEV